AIALDPLQQLRLAAFQVTFSGRVFYPSSGRAIYRPVVRRASVARPFTYAPAPRLRPEAQILAAMVTGPFRRARGTHQEPSGALPTRLRRNRSPPSRSDREPCQQHGRPPNAPSPFWPRDGASRLPVRAVAPAAS